MSPQLLLSPTTQRQVDQFVAMPAQAVLISGPAGSGKDSLSLKISAQLLRIDTEKLSNYPYFFLVKSPEGKTEIPIEAVRQLIAKLNLRVPGATNSINRIALIPQAHNLSREAQNALLKLLEEPPANTLLVLTTDSATDLLPTVLSRLQQIRVVAPALDQALEFFGPGYQPADIKSSYILSRGGPGLLSSLLDQKSDHPLKQSVDSAKTFLAANQLDRLVILRKMSKDKDQFKHFLDGLSRTVAALHKASIARGQPSKDLLRYRKAIESAIQAIDQNASVKLVSLALSVDM